MKAWAKYMIIDYKELPYHGFYAYGTTVHPYEFTVVVSKWWGFRKKIEKRRIGIILGTDVERLFQLYKDRWINKWIAK